VLIALLIAGQAAAPVQLTLTLERGVSIDRPALDTFLARCSAAIGTPDPVELRVVSIKTMAQLSPTPSGVVRLGRTYQPSGPGRPITIYVAKTKGFWRTLAHEWVHALSFSFDEAQADRLARRCLSASPR
jgi:hypothetical protein